MLGHSSRGGIFEWIWMDAIFEWSAASPVGLISGGTSSWAILLLTTHYLLPTAVAPIVGPDSLLTTYYLLLTTYYLLPDLLLATSYLLLTTYYAIYYLLLTTCTSGHCQLFQSPNSPQLEAIGTYYLLLTTHYLLLTTNYLLLTYHYVLLTERTSPVGPREGGVQRQPPLGDQHDFVQTRTG